MFDRTNPISSPATTRIRDRLPVDRPSVSFEFFPPKDEAGLRTLRETVERLRAFDPAFFSVTYGAGGGTRDRTLDVADELQRTTSIPTMVHLTCVGSDERFLRGFVDEMARRDLVNVLALRGDRRGDAETGEGFAYARDLVRFLRRHADLGIAAACYPETHPEATSEDDDLDRLVEKVEAGVDFLITQLFFSTEDYERFVDRARARGVRCRILPGVMPITSLPQIERIASLCGATIPSDLRARLDRHADDPDAVLAIGREHAIRQCSELLDRGAPGIHLYVLNRANPAVEILGALPGIGRPCGAASRTETVRFRSASALPR